MPWGYTVNCARILFVFSTDSLEYRVFLSLRMEGVFLVSWYLFGIQPLTPFIPHWQHVNLTAKLRKPFGTLMVLFHQLAHSPLKAQPLIRYLCHLSTHTWSPFCRGYSSRTYRHCPFRWITCHMEQTRRRTDCSPRQRCPSRGIPSGAHWRLRRTTSRGWSYEEDSKWRG